MNGGWGEFGAWSECSASCGGAYRSRYRTCNNPAPVNGGEDCTGSNTETGICNENPCPSKLNHLDKPPEITQFYLYIDLILIEQYNS